MTLGHSLYIRLFERINKTICKSGIVFGCQEINILIFAEPHLVSDDTFGSWRAAPLQHIQLSSNGRRHRLLTFSAHYSYNRLLTCGSCDCWPLLLALSTRSDAFILRLSILYFRLLFFYLLRPLIFYF